MANAQTGVDVDLGALNVSW